MSDPEPDELFRARLLRVVSEELRPFVRIAIGAELDAMGRKHDRFRTSVPLKGFDSFKNDIAEHRDFDEEPL